MKLLQQLEERGYRGRAVKVERLHDLQEEIEVARGLLDEAMRKRIRRLDFSTPDSLPEARSLIVVSVGKPQTRFTFTWNGERIPLLVPPSFMHERETNKQIENTLVEILKPEGYRVAKAALPLKLLAVHSGLASYGRNNITYISGLGSFHWLVAFFSDLPCRRDEWREVRMLERCQKCSACLQSCPTGAISPDRFLLHAERCITFYTEQPSDTPFPAWLEPSWRDCLAGCLHCQRVCPENRDALAWIEEGAEFSSEETALLLEGVPLDQLPVATVEKLEQSGLAGEMSGFPRNLKILFERMET